MILLTSFFEQQKVTDQWELEKVSVCHVLVMDSSFLHVILIEHITPWWPLELRMEVK